MEPGGRGCRDRAARGLARDRVTRGRMRYGRFALWWLPLDRDRFTPFGLWRRVRRTFEGER
jgi:hypothetical protein